MPFFKLLFLIAISYLPFRMAIAGHLGSFCPVERLALSIFGSLILFFISGMASFLAGAPGLHLVVPLGLLLHGVVFRWRRRGTRIDGPEVNALIVLTLASTWVLLAQTSIVNYSGGDWYGDWYEHYERALLFGGRLPLDHKFLDMSPLAGRPPLFNVACHYFMSFIGSGFSDYQVIATFLGSLVVLPAGTLLARLTRTFVPSADARRLVFPLVCIVLLLNPMVATNLIYPWTRMLSNGFLLMGLHLYLRVVLDRADGLLPACVGLLVAAHLTHYSADVVILPMALHLLCHVCRSLPRMRQPAVAAALVALTLGGLWHGWSVATYGFGGALASNTTWKSIEGRPIGWLSGDILTNLGRTLWPLMAQIDVRQMDPSQTWHALYDRLHPYWTSSLVGAISTSALLVVAAALVQVATGKRQPMWRSPRDIRLILPIMAVAFGIGFLVVPWVEAAGIAHLSLQPICIILLLLLLMAVLGGPRWVAGSFSMLYAAEAFLFYFLKTLARVTPTPTSLSALYSQSYYRNLRLKLVEHQLVFLSDQYPGPRELSRYVILGLVPVAGCVAWWLLRRIPSVERADRR